MQTIRIVNSFRIDFIFVTNTPPLVSILRVVIHGGVHLFKQSEPYHIMIHITGANITPPGV